MRSAWSHGGARTAAASADSKGYQKISMLDITLVRFVPIALHGCRDVFLHVANAFLSFLFG